MLDGFYFVKGDGSTQSSPPFPRQALNALFAALAAQRVGTTPNLTIGIDHRNRDDTVWGNAASFSAITSASLTVPVTEVVIGLKEEIRFTFTITATNPWEGYLIRMLAPAWFS